MIKLCAAIVLVVITQATIDDVINLLSEKKIQTSSEFIRGRETLKPGSKKFFKNLNGRKLGFTTSLTRSLWVKQVTSCSSIQVSWPRQLGK